MKYTLYTFDSTRFMKDYYKIRDSIIKYSNQSVDQKIELAKRIMCDRISEYSGCKEMNNAM